MQISVNAVVADPDLPVIGEHLDVSGDLVPVDGCRCTLDMLDAAADRRPSYNDPSGILCLNVAYHPDLCSAQRRLTPYRDGPFDPGPFERAGRTLRDPQVVDCDCS